MKRKNILIGCIALLLIGVTYVTVVQENTIFTKDSNNTPIEVTPISHATAVIEWKNKIIYTDPTGGAQSFSGVARPDIILITDIHGDHLSTSTLVSIVNTSTTLVVPQAVKDLLPQALASRTIVLQNGDTRDILGFTIKAIPMYNMPESSDTRHAKGRGNGYVVSREGFSVYIAGDTSSTPEMRALKDIDIAFIPMNLPFTMSVEEAASAVLAFEPKQVYPYHYRGQNGLSDVNLFKEFVDKGGKDIEVILKDWYPKQ